MSDDAPKLDNSIHVVITRPPWFDFYTLTLDDGTTEELELEEAKEWFIIRGADKDKVDKLFDQVWNFQRAEANIRNPKEPPRPKIPHAPNI